MQVPFVDLRAQYASIRDELEPAVLGVMERAEYVLGPAVSSFEQAFADYCECKHAVAVNSGTSALHLALLAAGVGPGDEVITVSATFVATVAAILYTGATPVLVDIDPETLGMSVEQCEAAITPRTKAIIPVHLHGLPVDLEPLVSLAQSRGLILIEDAAQAHGATYHGRKVGSFGTMACFSFYPGKNLGACGEGGAVTTNDDGLARKIRMLRDWGAERKYHHELPGFNYRMEGIQGAVLGVKLRHLDDWTARRQRVADLYSELLGDASVTLPTVPQDRTHVYHVFAVRVEDRDRVQAALSKAGIATGIHYPIPVHRQPAYRDSCVVPWDLDVTEQAFARVLSLPMYPELAKQQVEYVAAHLVLAIQSST